MNRSQDYRSQFIAQQNRRLKLCLLAALGLHVGAIAIALVQVPIWQWLNLRSKTATSAVPVEFVNLNAAKLAQPPTTTQRTASIDTIAAGDRTPEIPPSATHPAAPHPSGHSGTAQAATSALSIALAAGDRPAAPLTPTAAPHRPSSEQTSSRIANGNRRSIATGSIDAKRDKIWSAYDASVQRQIAQQWSPAAVSLSVDRTRRSVIRFTIDRQGQLQSLAVTQSSGFERADRMALAAIRAAAPFPHFPRNAKEQTLSVTQTFIYNSD